MEQKKITIPDLQRMKKEGKKITMLTAYDYPFASLLDRAAIDIVLVGDSLAMTALGYDSTVFVTMDEMLHHARAVRRAVRFALLVGDMPFMSYQVSQTEAVRNAGRFIKEAGCDAVKLEWMPGIDKVAKAIVDSGIAVMGHTGLTPQTAVKLGGFVVQGKTKESAKRILNSAIALEKAGCFSCVLECIPAELARQITTQLSIPTIGIGAGRYCDGQVLVTDDMLGLFEKFRPKFVKRYADLSSQVLRALSSYKEEVTSGRFPTKEHSFLV